MSCTLLTFLRNRGRTHLLSLTLTIPPVPRWKADVSHRLARHGPCVEPLASGGIHYLWLQKALPEVPPMGSKSTPRAGP